MMASPVFWLAAAVVVMSPVGPRRLRAVVALGLWLMVVTVGRSRLWMASNAVRP
jgi:hypothetical protein